MRASACCWFLAWLVLALAGTPLYADQEIAAERSRPVSDLVLDLSSGDFAVRRQASDALLRAGAEAVDPLQQAAVGASPEVQHRIVQILRQLMLASEPEVYDPAETALEALADSTNRALSGHARQLLRSHQTLRSERAIRKIEELGGIVEYFRADVAAGFGGFAQAGERPQRTISHIVLSSRWKGGDEGLKYIARLSYVPRIYVATSGNSSPVSAEALEKLQAALPHMEIEERSFAYLGIGGSLTPHPQGCVVDQVKAGTAAERGGPRNA